MQPTDDVTAHYTKLGLSRDRLHHEVARQAKDCLRAASLIGDSTVSIDQAVQKLSAQEVHGKLPLGRPLTLQDIYRAGALSTRLANVILNEDLMGEKLEDIGSAHYKDLRAAPNVGPKSIFELISIVEVNRQSHGFTLRGCSQSLYSEKQAARTAQSWQKLTRLQQDRAIGRLVKCLKDPEFAAAIMGQVLPLIDAKLGTEPPPRPRKRKEPGVA